MNVFDVLHKDRSQIDDSYLRHLVARDGPLVDITTSELRERRLRALVPTEATDGAPAEVVASVRRLFESESYTVDALLEASSDHPVIAQIARQESYHTRILSTLLRALGQPEPARAGERKPPLILRWLLLGVVRLPESISTVLLFIGEFAGVLLLRELRHALETSGRDELVPLLDEILIDELGHLAYNHAKLSAFQLRIAAMIARPMLWAAAAREPLARDSFRAAHKLTWAEVSSGFRSAAWLPALEPSAAAA
jgi:hypothetical protein